MNPRKHLADIRIETEEAKSTATLILKKVEATEGLSEKEIEQLTGKNMTKLESCLENKASHDPVAKGKWIIHIQINARGEVVSIQVDQPSSGNKRFADCLSNQLRKWTFPTPTGVNEATVVIHLTIH
jgi:hypothetical protein